MGVLGNQAKIIEKNDDENGNVTIYGVCSYGSNCSGGGGTCSYGSSCGGGGGKCSYGSSCGGR